MVVFLVGYIRKKREIGDRHRELGIWLDNEQREVIPSRRSTNSKLMSRKEQGIWEIILKCAGMCKR